MTWTRQEIRTAKTSDNDVRIVFSADAGKLYADVILVTDVPGPTGQDYARLQCAGTGHNAGLTAQERTDLVALLIKIRDAALPLAGFIQV